MLEANKFPKILHCKSNSRLNQAIAISAGFQQVHSVLKSALVPNIQRLFKEIQGEVG